MKIGLGSAQFGLDYGITNAGGRTPLPEVKRILERAARFGIEVIDTAPLYGHAEEALGAALPPRQSFRIVTKTPAFGGRAVTAGEVEILERTFGSSLARLNAQRTYGLLVHHAEDLLAPGGKRLFAAMAELRGRGLVEKIGVSAYSAEEIDGVMERFSLDLIQVPESVLDQRLLASGHLKALKAAGVEVHARSLFLQGVLLLSPRDVPEHLLGLRRVLERFHSCLERHGAAPVQGALAFAASVAEIDVALVGVNDSSQLEEICRWREAALPPAELRDFAVGDDMLIDPRRWPRQAKGAALDRGSA